MSFKSLTVSGVELLVPARDDCWPFELTDKQALRVMVAQYRNQHLDQTRHSLPRFMVVDGVEVDVENTRLWMAVGRQCPSSEVSDLEVIEMISNGGAHGEVGNALDVGRQLPRWHSVLRALQTRVSDPRVLEKADSIRRLYVGKRGLMVVDVVSSAQRRYETHVKPKILDVYERTRHDLSLKGLVKHAPSELPLRTNEADTMVAVANFLLEFSRTGDDEDAIAAFAKRSDEASVRGRGIEINGIGPVLYEYLRLLSGADTIKIDRRVRATLGQLGIPEGLFSDAGLMWISKALALELKCELRVLDQALWDY